MTWRLAALLASVVALIGALWGIERYGYERGWSARDEEVQAQAKLVAEIDLDTLIRNMTDAFEAEQRMQDELAQQLGIQRDLRARLDAHLQSPPTDEALAFARCPVDPDTRRLLDDARAAANAAIAAGDPAGHAAASATPAAGAP